MDRSVLYQQESSNNNTQRLYDTNTTTTAGTTDANKCELSQLQATTTPDEFSNINNTDTTQSLLTTEEGTIPRKSVHQSSDKTVSIRFPKEFSKIKYVPLQGAENSFADSPCPTEQIGGGSSKGGAGLGCSVEGSHSEVVRAEVTTSSGDGGEVVVNTTSSTTFTTAEMNTTTTGGEEGGEHATTTATTGSVEISYRIVEPDSCSIDI